MRFVPAFAAALAGVAMTAGPVQSAWPVNPDLGLPVRVAPRDQVSVSAVPDGAGGVYVLWLDAVFAYPNVDSSARLCAQHVRAGGVRDPAWPADGLRLGDAPGAQVCPAAMPDGSGGLIAAWTEVRPDLLDPDSPDQVSYRVRAQRVPAGEPVFPSWSGFGVAISVAGGSQLRPSIVPDGTGGATVSWLNIAASNGAGILCQHVLASGVPDPEWPPGGCALGAQPATTFQGAPGVSDGAGGAIFAWLTSPNAPLSACLQHVRAGGSIDPAWPPGGVLTGGSARVFDPPALAADPWGGAYVAWSDEWWAAGGTTDVYVQHVVAGGHLDVGWPAFGVAVCAAEGHQVEPRIIGDGRSGVIVAWTDYRAGETDSSGTSVARVYAHHVRADGSVDPGWPANGRLLSGAAGGAGAVLVADGTATPSTHGGALAVWARAAGDGVELRAQHIRADGSLDPGWPEDGVLVATRASVQQMPVAAIASPAGPSANGLVVAWSDDRYGDFDVFAQRVNPDGSLGGGLAGAATEPLRGIELRPARANPARSGVTVLRAVLASDAPATLEVFDAHGRRLESRDVGGLGIGPHDVSLPSRGRLRPGVYFARLRQAGVERVTRVAVLE